jgi:hypothetical protein
MAPLMKQSFHDSSEDVFSNERFSLPLKMVLEAASYATTVVVKGRRSSPVRFEDQVQVINPETEFFTDEDVAIRWFGAEDLHLIKMGAKQQSVDLRNNAKNHDSYLCVAHRKTSLMLKSDFKALVKLTPSTPDQDLSKWCSYMDGRRGLERFASRDYAALRRVDITNTRTSVIHEYSRQRSEGIFDLEFVANLARDASRRARTFARFFAAADAEATKHMTAPTETSIAAAGGSSPATLRCIPARCQSHCTGVSSSANELAAPQRCAPPRKRSKQYHRQDFFVACR